MGENHKLNAAISKINRQVIDGLNHGHFEYSLQSEIISGNRRSLIFKAGMTHRFIIEEGEIKEWKENQ